MYKKIFILLLPVLFTLTVQAQQAAFPGAEGFGMYTFGGRGGRIIKVTNLDDSGEGSLRAAVEAEGPRIVVFELSGTIELKSRLVMQNGYITIAGQTAPGDGICIKGYEVYLDGCDEVIIRYLRFRMGDEARQANDAFGGRGGRNVIIDHCSMSWSIDECASFYANENFTMQWCLLTESLRNSYHYGPHGFGGIWGGNRASFHHNLLAHHSNRNPRFRGHKRNSPVDAELVDLRNNVIYNYKGTCYGSEGGGSYNMVNNYYKYGPASGNIDNKEFLHVNAATAEYNWLELEGEHGIFYVNGNYIYGKPEVTKDNWNGGVNWDAQTNIDRVKSEVEFDRGNIRTDDPETAYQKVLEHTGASLSRDTVDKRAVHDTRTGTATVMDGGNGSTNGYIDTQDAVGGWPVLNSLPAPTDTDGDGMPDAWELSHGLDPNDPADGNEDRDHDVYTNIEEYINSLAPGYFDTDPFINMVKPGKDEVFITSASSSIDVEVYSSDYNGGSVVKMELYLDDELILENNNSAKIFTTLENVSPGMHQVIVKSIDDTGNISVENTTVYIGSEEVRIHVAESSNGRAVLDPPGGKYVRDPEGKSIWSHPVKINFQPEEDYSVPEGYIADFGGKYCDKWNGYTYGWMEEYNPSFILNVNEPGVWNASRNFEKDGNVYSWGIELPGGMYKIRLGLGGEIPGAGMTELKIDVEGIRVEDSDGIDLTDEHILENVPVLDGQLTLTSVGQSRICFIEIELLKLISPGMLSVRMADSEMSRFAEPWMTEYATFPSWNYKIGVLTGSMMDMCEYTGDMKYFDYVEPYYDLMIDDDGIISRYKLTDFNIDNINPGKVLFALYWQTGKEKYRMALDTLRHQMTMHPRTSEGGFWHKKRYPWQMWLDGLYMGSPFLAQYAKEFREPALFDDVANQVILMAEHTHDAATGLYYHAWDESREQRWANRETGQSPHFWGRGMGWFAMAQVDILDFMPEEHPRRPQLLEIVKKTADGIVKYQDQGSGVWYQVPDLGNREGNYLEATASNMFVYFLFKAVRKGYIDGSYLSAAEKGYMGILKTFIKENEDGTITLTGCCSGAGLGGNPYRDGSFEYYITEEIVENDPKGTGPFIWASMEYETYKGINPDLSSRQIAFPGAEGFGAFTKGGRGGKVIYVDNLQDSGPGSLRAAVEETVPRMVIFKVSGTIELKSNLIISSPYITIAGQTAPGDGICLKDFLLQVSGTHDVVIRCIRVRPGIASGLPGDQIDAIDIVNSRYVIIDHCSLGWSTDESLNTTKGSQDITVQWCMISEPLNMSIHVNGVPHGYAASIGGNRASFHHNLFANAAGRNPSVAGFRGGNEVFDFSNNVVFNWEHRSCDGKPVHLNFVGNYYKPGPATRDQVKRRLVRIEDASEYGVTSIWYISDNIIEGYPQYSADNWSGAVDFDTGTSMEKNRSYTPFENGGYMVRDAETVYEEVLNHAGVIAPKRDVVEERIIREVRTGKTTYGNGIIDRVDQTEGWPELKSAPAPQDSDNDGMPDDWEIKNGLDPGNEADGRLDSNGDGYTNLEEYLNSLIAIGGWL